MFRLEGKITYLIPFSEKHLYDEKYYRWLTDYEVVKTINRLDYITPVRFEEVKKYCETVMNSKTDLFWALYYKPEDLFVGTIRINGIDWFSRRADVGILIGDRSHWGKGIAKDGIAAVGKYLFDVLGMRKLTAGTMAVNPGMIKVFKRLGFREEGVLRQQDRFEAGYCDHIYLGCFREEFLPDIPGKII